MNNHILIRTKIQAIYYQTEKDELGIAHATKKDNVRITIAESEDILLDRKIEFKEVLKVKFEDIDLEIPLNEYENYII